MKSLAFGMALVALVTLTGCEIQPYETSSLTDGNVVVVNKWTGSATLVNGKSLVALNEVSRADLQRTITSAGITVDPEAFPTQIADTVVRASAWGRYHDGKILYRLKLFPADNVEYETWVTDLKRLRSINLEFLDSEGFAHTKAHITAMDLTRIVEADGETVAALTANGYVDTSAVTYKEITNIEIGWRNL